MQAKVEAMVAARNSGTSFDPETSNWLWAIEDSLHRKLSRAGLVPSREHTDQSLGGLLDVYLSTLNVKPQTVVTYRQTQRSLEDYFGRAERLDRIGPVEAERWRAWLRDDQKLAPPTISKRVKTARQIFKCAVKWKMLASNPFQEVRAGTQTNRARMHFIDRAVAARVLDA